MNTSLKEPAPSEPHGTITITREYKARPGPELEEFGSVSGFKAPNAFRAPPGDTVVFLDATFFHLDERKEWVTRSYTEYESHYDSCASRDSNNNCRGATTSVPVTKYRRELEVIVTRTNDAQCKVDVPMAVQPGSAYRVHYVWEADNTCRAACEVRTDAGFVECPLPPKVKRGVHVVPREHVERPLMPIGLGAVAVGGIGVVTGLLFLNAAAGRKTPDEDRKPYLEKAGIVLGIAGPLFIGGVVLLALPGKRVVEVVPEATGASVRGSF